jgi:hypothetical protein
MHTEIKEPEIRSQDNETERGDFSDVPEELQDNEMSKP